MPNTSRMKWPIPEKDSDPWFDRFVSMMGAVDASGYAAREDRNTLPTGGGTFSFSSAVLSWTSSLDLFSSPTGFLWQIAAGSVTVQDGQLIYVILPRAPTSNTTVVPITASNLSAVADGDSAYVIALRRGTTVFFRNGCALADGDSWEIFAHRNPVAAAPANTVIKSDGSSYVASRITDDGSVITLPGEVVIGDVASQQQIEGPTLQLFAVPNTSYPFGEVNRMEISGVVPAWPADLFVQVIRNSATADCTTHTQHSGGLAIEITGTRSAGSLDLTNTALEVLASGAQSNEAVHILGGDLVFDGGGEIRQNSGIAFFGGTFLAATGTFFAESSGTNAIDISGSPTNAIRMRAAASQIDVNNVAPSTLTFMNQGGGTFALIVQGKVQLGSGSGPSWTSGSGSPEGVVTAPVGSLYSRTDGGAGTSLYVKESGAGNTGWIGK